MTKAKTRAGKRRGVPKQKAVKHGSQPAPEDTRAVYNGMTLRTSQRSRPTPVGRTEAVFAPMSQIERRLITAMKTIRALPDREKRFQVMKGASIPYLQDYMDAYSSADIKVAEYVPSPADVSDCLTALSWVRHVDKRKWKIMWLRSFGFSFGLIGRYISRSDETARRWYREGITDAWSTANGAAGRPR